MTDYAERNNQRKGVMLRINGRLAAIEQQRVSPASSGQTTEPTLADLFSDPIIYTLMNADQVDYRQLDELLRVKRKQLGIRRRKKMARSAMAHLQSLCVQFGRMS